MPESISIVTVRGPVNDQTVRGLEEAGTFIVTRDNELWSFTPLPVLTLVLGSLVVASRVERRAELEADVDRRRVVSWLLRRHLERHIASFSSEGLEREDRKNAKRAYFVGEGSGPRALRYDSSLRRNIRREVVKRRAEGERAWFENEGFGYEVKALGDQWAVRIKPFYMFTGADARTPLPSFARTARATRRMKFDRNDSVDSDLTFWARFLSRGQPTINIGQHGTNELLLDGSFLTVEVHETEERARGMKIDIHAIPEPLLDFGHGRTGVEPRRVLAQPREAGAEIGKLKLALVGPETEVRLTKAWLEGMARFRPARESNASRYRDWPGWRKALGVDVVIEKRFVRTFTDAQVELGLQRAGDGPGFDAFVQLFQDKIQALFGDDRPDCVIVCLPEAVGDLRVENPGLTHTEREALRRLQAEEEGDQLSLFAPTPEELKAAEDLRMQADELLFRTFYRALKARVMDHPNPIPLQVIRRDTVERADDKGQSHATRAWHMGVSLLYKSGRTPWRPADLPANTCFVGISFHYLKRRSGGLVYASLAQAVSTEFEPFALSGAAIDQDQRRDRRPYLNEEQARGLLDDILREYEARAGVSPDRIVFHKTSAYEPEEIAGFQEAAAGRVASCELVWLRPTSFRLVRKGQQEPWRGTLCTVGDENYLFTMGFMRWWREYPGPHIPAPVEIGSALATDLRERAREILALTKMNWNSSEGVSRYPVTLSFARKVGEIMAELPEGKAPNPSYRFYM